MINKLLIEIKERQDKIEKLFNNTEYFENLEQYMEKVQKENETLRNELQLKNKLLGEIVKYIRSYQMNITSKNESKIKLELTDENYIRLLEMLNVDTDREKEFIKRGE